MKTRVIYYVLILLITAGMFIWASGLNEEQVKHILGFYAGAIELFFGGEHYYSDYYAGFYNNNYYYYLDKSCVGLNGIIMIFGLCAAVNIGKFNGIRRAFVFAASAAAAVVIGVSANILRLFSSVYFTAFAGFKTIHLILGIVINLSALVLCYWFSIKHLGAGAHEEGI